jgi:hypothetical protein
MPILALFQWHGDPEALIAAYDRELEDAPSVTLDQPSRTLHVFARGEDGAVVVDLWESEEDFRRMVDDPEFQRNVEASGWPSEPDVEILEVHATMPWNAGTRRSSSDSSLPPDDTEGDEGRTGRGYRRVTP